MEPLKIIFFGSPEIALPTLEALRGSQHQVVSVISQPDKPVGRGQELKSPAVAQYAKENNLSLFQPTSLKNNADFFEKIRALSPDVIIVVAYGKIFPKELLDLPRYGCINVHFSLLPRYRGAAPIQWALMNLEEETGVTTFLLNEKLDQGPILMQKKVQIHEEDHSGLLASRLAVVGAELLMETLDTLKHHEPLRQNDLDATFAPPLKKEDGLIDWKRKARLIQGQIRGLNPWPGTFTRFQGQLFKIFSAEEVEGRRAKKPGEILIAEEGRLEVSCGQGVLRLKEVQLEGKRRMSVDEFLHGRSLKEGDVLGV